MRAYFDSSALVKRYVEEPGSDEVEEILGRTEELAVGILCPPEIVSALARKRRERQISLSQVIEAKTAFFRELEEMAVCGLTKSVVETAIRFIELVPLRTLDALHLACAADWNAEAVVSADRKQLEAAKKLGLRVIGI
jgi:predicted nucleic acid-binding protein